MGRFVRGAVAADRVQWHSALAPAFGRARWSKYHWSKPSGVKLFRLACSKVFFVFILAGLFQSANAQENAQSRQPENSQSSFAASATVQDSPRAAIATLALTRNFRSSRATVLLAWLLTVVQIDSATFIERVTLKRSPMLML
jgi:hypothetical protein